MPFIVAAPGLKPHVVVREQVRLIDVAPTIASLAGQATDAPTPNAGGNLRVLLEGGVRRDVPVSLAESWYPRLHFGWSEFKSARVGEWKYIRRAQA